MERLREYTAIPGKRVSVSVHDKNGWHNLFINTGRNPSGSRGMSASELLDRFEKNGVPSQEAVADNEWIGKRYV